MVKPNRFEKMLREQLVETYFIRTEAFIQAIRNEGAQLFTFPERPKDLKRHHKNFVEETTEKNEQWENYWFVSILSPYLLKPFSCSSSLQKLSNTVVNGLVRAATISVDLQAPWLTQNAATYLWNYSMHVISLSDHGILIPSFQTMFDCMREIVNENMIDIITQYGIVLAHGLIQKSLPASSFYLDNIFELPCTPSTVDKKSKNPKEPSKSKASPGGQVLLTELLKLFNDWSLVRVTRI